MTSNRVPFWDGYSIANVLYKYMALNTRIALFSFDTGPADFNAIKKIGRQRYLQLRYHTLPIGNKGNFINNMVDYNRTIFVYNNEKHQ